LIEKENIGFNDEVAKARVRDFLNNARNAMVNEFGVIKPTGKINYLRETFTEPLGLLKMEDEEADARQKGFWEKRPEIILITRNDLNSEIISNQRFLDGSWIVSPFDHAPKETIGASHLVYDGVAYIGFDVSSSLKPNDGRIDSFSPPNIGGGDLRGIPFNTSQILANGWGRNYYYYTIPTTTPNLSLNYTRRSFV